MDIREVKKIYDADKQRGKKKQISHYARMYGGDFYYFLEGKYILGEIDFNEYQSRFQDLKAALR